MGKGRNMKINQISDFITEELQNKLRLHKKLIERGQGDLAKEVLAQSSKTADFLLEVTGVRKTYTRYQDLNQETNYDCAVMDQDYQVNEDRSEKEEYAN